MNVGDRYAIIRRKRYNQKETENRGIRVASLEATPMGTTTNWQGQERHLLPRGRRIS